MATKQTTVDFILEQAAGAGAMTAKKMFGEFGIYCGEKMVALVCDDQLFLKVTPPAREFLGNAKMGLPYPGAKPCFLISGDHWDDREWMGELFKLTAKNLPSPKKKGARRPADHSQ
jgi:TfoX/Sxy family transcriptional regulator of competence genes